MQQELKTAATLLIGGGLVVGLGLIFLTAQGSPTGPDPSLTVPQGFHVDRVAGPPLVNRPLAP